MGKTEGEEVVTEKRRTEKDTKEILLDMIAGGYMTIIEQDKEIERLKADLDMRRNSYENLSVAYSKLNQNFNEISAELRRLKSAEIDDGK
jgi:hypothetical protein